MTDRQHCLEAFASDPDVRVIVDVSPMKRVYFDVERGAVAVEARATVGETFRHLLLSGMAALDDVAHYSDAAEAVPIVSSTEVTTRTESPGTRCQLSRR